MRGSSGANRLIPPRVRLLAVVTLASGVLVAGCGGSSRSAARSGSKASGAGGSGPLAFAKCMRADGVPKFPDPGPGGNFDLSFASGVDPSSPAFRAAQSKCGKLEHGAPPNFGSTTHPSPRTLAKMLRLAGCMHTHGIAKFPDPRTSIPVNPAAVGIREVYDFHSAILLLPTTINFEAPAYARALAACHAPPLGIPH